MSQDGTWLWNHITNAWEKAPAVVTAVRLIAAGPVVAGTHKLYWISLNPGAGNSVIELTNAIAALGVIVFDHFDTSREGHMLSLSPPMQFDTGIYLETLTNLTSAIFGYI